MTEASKTHGVSRFSIYDWQRKLKKAAKGEGESPASGPTPAEIETQRDREILTEWRKHPGLGPSQIRNQLRRAGVKVAVTTVRRVMEDAGYRPPKVKREPHDERYDRGASGCTTNVCRCRLVPDRVPGWQHVSVGRVFGVGEHVRGRDVVRRGIRRRAVRRARAARPERRDERVERRGEHAERDGTTHRWIHAASACPPGRRRAR